MFSNEEILRTLSRTEIGGGLGYDEHEIEGPDDANVTVRSSAEFLEHAGDADTVIWIPGDERIEVDRALTLRATVASDRGLGGSPGALLYTTERGASSQAWDGGTGRGLIQARGRGALLGLRYRGPYHDHYDDPRYPGYIPLDSGSDSTRKAKRKARYARGVKVHSSDVEIANVEIFGWPNQAIHMGAARSAPYSPHIHHIYGHDCMMVGAGYVVDVIRGYPTIEKSYFDSARHAIDGFGHENCGYELDSNVFGPSTVSHAVDMHCLGENGYRANDNPSSSTWRARAGDRMEITNNTFLYRQDIDGKDQECVVIRGVPKDECLVENNRFMHLEPPALNPGNTSPGYAWRQVNVSLSGWDVETDRNGYTPNFTRRNNHFGLERITLPDGVEPGSTRRIATRITNRPGKSMALRGLVESTRR